MRLITIIAIFNELLAMTNVPLSLLSLQVACHCEERKFIGVPDGTGVCLCDEAISRFNNLSELIFFIRILTSDCNCICRRAVRLYSPLLPPAPANCTVERNHRIELL